MSPVSRIWDELKRIARILKPSPNYFHDAADGVLAIGLLVVTIYFYFFIVTDFAWQKIPAFLVYVAAPALLGLLIIGLAAITLKLPKRMLLRLALVLPLMMLAVFPGSAVTGYLSGAIVVTLFALVAAGTGSMLRNGFDPKQRIAESASLAIGIIGLCICLYLVFSEKEPANPALQDYILAGETLPLPNPGLPGEFEVGYTTYGSGEDLRRPEYGEEAAIISRRVDGSKLIDNWDGLAGWFRSSYWGFGVDELPLQARVWYPVGEGPFPLALVVHGNHSMEDYSDPGYDYLGELFASRGIILASVDENFINGTGSARVEFFSDRPGLREENDARGWLLLEHLALFRDWNSEQGHFFYNKVDMERLALIGHSRGGEAVGIAAAFNQLSHYPDDASQEFDFGFNLRGVIAIAPVYGQYQPRERYTPIRDVNYFTIHGDMDGDVQSFEGAAQYSRTSFSGNDYRFRSSLYVIGANHGQFNTTWENLDTSPFRAWALDLGRIMPREDQRDVARVYFGAFMEVVLRDNLAYLPLFKDARNGADWLPNTFFINQFADSSEEIIVDFEEDLDLTTLDAGSGSVRTRNLTRWYETANTLKYDELDSYSVVVAWDEEAQAEADVTPMIEFDLNEETAASSLILSLSAMDISTKPTGWEAKEQNESEAEETNEEESDSNQEDLLDWSIELVDSRGNKAMLPLSYDSALYPLINAVPRRADFLDSADPTEILFRRFEYPLSAFQETTASFDAEAIETIRFLFDRSSKGAIILDYIAIAR